MPSELQPSEFQPRWLPYILIWYFIHVLPVIFFQYWYYIVKRGLASGMCSYFCFVFLCCLTSLILDVLRTISWPTLASSTSGRHSCSVTGHTDCWYCYTKERLNGWCGLLRKWESQTLDDAFSSQLNKLHGSRGILEAFLHSHSLHSRGWRSSSLLQRCWKMPCMFASQKTMQ